MKRGFLVVGFAFCAFLALLAFPLDKPVTVSAGPQPVIVKWAPAVDARTDKYVSLWFDTRYQFEPQFVNEVDGQKGEFENNECFIPGQSSWAEEIAVKPSVNVVDFYKHSLIVSYEDDFLNKGNLWSEAEKVREFLSAKIGRTVIIERMPPLYVDDSDCAVWKAPFKCSLETLYVPIDYKANDFAIVQIPGMESYDFGQDGGKKGYRRFHKSLMYSWRELKGQIEPYLK